MRVLGTVFLVLLSICAFVHYPLSVIHPLGASDNVRMVFNFEFPHVFLASILSLAYIGFRFYRLNFSSKLVRLLALAAALIFLSSVIFAVPFYRAVESLAFFAVPVAVFLAVKDSGRADILYYFMGILFILNLLYCLLFSNNAGIAGNQNWLAATLIMSLPFFLLCVKKLPRQVFYTAVLAVSLPLVYVLVKTSARALIPAGSFFIFYFCVQRKSLKFNSLVFGSLALLTVTFGIMKSDKVKRVFQQDIRGPLAVDTLSLIMSSPLLGTGPGNFQKDFPPHASETLKRRLHYSSIVEHPHNELLNMMAGCGIPVALIWLLLIYSVLGKRDDFEGLVFQFGLLTGFVMGLADKPLVESPSAIVFLILCGLLLKDKEILSEEERDAKPVKVFGAVLALGCLFFAVMRVQAELKSRYYYRKAEDLRVSMNSMNQRQLVPQMFEFYKKSAEADPYFISSAYSAATISLHFYNSLSQDKQLLERMINLEPDYSDFNKWIGLYYMKQARLLAEGEEKIKTEAEAEKYYLRNFELSPWSINRCRELIRFYLTTENFDKVEEWILKAGEIARDRLRSRFTHTDRIDLEGDLQWWISEVQAGRQPPFHITDGMKAGEAGDYFPFNIFERTNNLRIYTSVQNTGLDLAFWQRRLYLIAEMKKRSLQSTADILKHLASFEVEGSDIKWPADTLREGKGSVRSIASLACTMNTLLGNSSSLLLNEKGVILCILFEAGKTWIWNCEKGAVYESSVESFHGDASLRKTITGSEEDDFVYELFCYPEAFCLRNQLISNLVSIHKDIPEFCLSPTLERLRLRKKIGAREIRYANKHIGLLDAAAVNR